MPTSGDGRRLAGGGGRPRMSVTRWGRASPFTSRSLTPTSCGGSCSSAGPLASTIRRRSGPQQRADEDAAALKHDGARTVPRRVARATSVRRTCPMRCSSARARRQHRRRVGQQPAPRGTGTQEPFWIGCRDHRARSGSRDGGEHDARFSAAARRMASIEDTAPSSSCSRRRATLPISSAELRSARSLLDCSLGLRARDRGRRRTARRTRDQPTGRAQHGYQRGPRRAREHGLTGVARARPRRRRSRPRGGRAHRRRAGQERDQEQHEVQPARALIAEPHGQRALARRPSVGMSRRLFDDEQRGGRAVRRGSLRRPRPQ